jgi:acyl-CoA reductase-like NAD-dependent aldehyde dehydrogenase
MDTAERAGRETSAREVQAAVERARSAQERWGALPFAGRREYLLAFRDLMLDRVDEVVDAVCEETGKTRSDALVLEVAPTVEQISYYARRGEQVLCPKRVSPGLLKHKRAYKTYEPFGVVGVISPWNYPFYLTAGPVITALFAGNAVVLKPSEVTPKAGLKLAELLRGAGTHPDILQVVTGGGETGHALVTGGINKLVFTGSVATGKRVMAAAAENLVPVVLELGGKDPMIVCEDADVERASSAAVWGAFQNTGQACVSVERVYAVEGVHDEFVRRVAEKAQAVRIGADIGPITFPPQMETIEEHVRDAVERGAAVLTGGRRAAEWGELYYEPTVLTGVDHSMKVMREETFGPVLPVMRVQDAAEAVRLANDSPYGLNSSVFTRSAERGRELAREIKSGAVCINDCIISTALPGLPYGGIQDSGMGHTHGDEGLLELSRIKAVAEDRMGLPHELHWFPRHRNAAAAARLLMRLLFRRGLKEKLRALRRG